MADELALPDYHLDIHIRPANPWWNTIPTGIGVLLLVTLVAAVLLMIAFS